MKVFVSGTFADMDLARDTLNKLVRPRLSKKTREKYGQEIDFTDLRWGVDTENAVDAAVKATLAGLEAIDEAAPPMPIVILLGDRCSRPLAAEIVALAEREFAFTAEHKPCSITELEIEYGALRDEEHLSRAVFCYIDREDEKPDEAMRLLRRRLGARVPSEQILHFIQTEDGILDEETFLPFDKVITDVLWRHINDKLVQPDEATQEDLLHRSYMEKKAAGFRGRRGLFDRGMQELEKHTPVLLLTGETGAGKSSLLSRLLSELQDAEAPCEVLPIYCGLTEKVDSGMEVLQRIVRRLETALDRRPFDPQTFDGWKDYQEILCIQYEKSDLPRLVIGIDAVDQLRDSNVARELLFLPFGTYGKVQFIVSFTPDIVVPHRLSRAPIITLDRMDKQEVREIIRGILSEYNKRELSRSVEDRLIELTQDAVPLRLNLMVQALRMMDMTEFGAAHKVTSMQGINHAQNAILDRLNKPDMLSLCREFLKFACERIDERLYESLRGIAAAPYGLTSELLAALEPDTFDLENFLLLRHYLQEVFIRRADGRYDFAHKCLRQALVFTDLDGRSDDPALSRRLFDVLYELKDTHPIRTSDILYFARQCKQINYSTDYILNAFHRDDLQHRREPILRYLKDWKYCELLVDNLPLYLERVFKEKENPVDALPKAVDLLLRYVTVFGDLLARGDDDRREETLARERLYSHFLTTLNKAFSSVQSKLLRNREDLELTVTPYVTYQSEWFLACAAYERCHREQALFEPKVPTPSFVFLREGIAADFLSPLGEQQIAEYDAMDRDTFRRRFFAHPNRVFREVFRYWLNAEDSVELDRLFDKPLEAVKCFVRVYEAVADALYSRDTFELAQLNEERVRYRRVHRRAREFRCRMAIWPIFYNRVRRRRREPIPLNTDENVYHDFMGRYRDLNHEESAAKYATFLRYATIAVEALSDRSEEAIACCRDAVTAAERAVNYSLGRGDCIDYHFAFCATMRRLLGATDAPARLKEIERVYERQFDFLLDSELTLQPSTYGELMDLAYPQAMQALYESAQTPAVPERQAGWQRRAFAAACKLLEVAEYDSFLHSVRRLYFKKQLTMEKLRIPESHDRLLGTVLVAVDALDGINRATDGFDGTEEATEMYDCLEEDVLTNFPYGSFRYPDSALRRRILALIKERAFPLFTALLERLHGYLIPNPSDGLLTSDDEEEDIY